MNFINTIDYANTFVTWFIGNFFSNFVRFIKNLRLSERD